MPAFRLLLACAALVLAGPATPPRIADPALWMVRDADTVVWLFGTVHALPHGLRWFDGRVRDAFARSDTLVLELVAPTPAEQQAALAEVAPPAGAPDLPARLPPPYPARLRAKLRATGYPADAFDRSDPWVAATTLGSAALHRAGYRRERGGEAVLAAAAAAAGKRVEGLETLGQQFAMFDRLSPRVQRAMLAQVLDDSGESVRAMDRTAAAWAAGDVAVLSAVADGEAARIGRETRAALLTRRNAAWSGWIARRMARPGRVFVAVGAAHLAGRDSVQAALGQRGLRAVRVR